ncbi:MAG: UDP-2,3-diacylglucosamine diphosphatase LpxI [Negativicutes bacterium]|jgi:hypothetical protein
MEKKVGLVAGIGRLPVEFIKAAKAQGYSVVTIAVVDKVEEELKLLSDKYYDINVMKLDKIIKTLKKEQITQITMLGKVTKEVIFSKWFLPDFRLIKLIAKLPNRSDDTVTLALINEINNEGIQAMDQTLLLKKMFIPVGVYTRRRPSEAELADIKYALKMAKAIGRYDIGQTVVVKDCAVIAVEAIEGTNKCILRGGELTRGGAVVAKVAKPMQDSRFDMPAVGTETIEAMITAQAKVLAIEADQTLIVDFEKTIALADKHGIAVVAEIVNNCV